MSAKCQVMSERQRPLLLVCMLLLVGGVASAAPTVSALDNGLKVCVAEDYSSDVVAVQVIIHATADCEPDDKAGLRTVLQHALRAACDKQIEADEKLSFLLDMDDSGAGLSLNTDWEYVALGYTGTTETLEGALAFLAQAMFRPELTEELFTSARDLVQQAAGGPAGAPAESTMSLFRLALLHRAPRAFPLGTPTTIGNLSLADISAFRQRFYVPSLTTVAVLGPVEAGRAQQMVKAQFGGLPAGDPTLPPPPEANPESDVRVGGNTGLSSPDARRMDIASLVVGVPAPGLGDPDEAVTYVMHAILGADGAADGRIEGDEKLWEALGLPFGRDESGRGQFIESLPPPTSLRSYLAIHAYIAPRQAETARQALLKSFESLAQAAPTGDEVRRAREYVAGSLGVLYDTPANRALLMGRAATLGRGDLTGTTFTQQVMRVTPDDVRRVAKAYFGTHGVGIEFPEDAPDDTGEAAQMGASEDWMNSEGRPGGDWLGE